MIQGIPQSDQFTEQLRYSLQQETLDSPPITFARNKHIYLRGDSDGLVYYIDSGQVKLHILSSEHRGCLLTIHGPGDFFGELCLAGTSTRIETATAMKPTRVRQIPGANVFARLCRDPLFVVGFVQYMAKRIAEQQEVIANLTTIDSEHRLGKTLLRLAQTLGSKAPQSTFIDLRITHEELSEMVGTTRPRISVFMQRLRKLGLIETKPDHSLIVKEKKLALHLAKIV